MLDEKDFLSKLDEYVEGALATKYDLDSENVQLDSKEKANFFLRKVLNLQGEIEEINALSDKTIEDYKEAVNKYRDERIKSLNSSIAYLSRQLETFARAELANKKTKTLSLPDGKLSFRKINANYAYDKNKMLDLVRKENLNDFIEIKENVKNSEIKKNIIEKEGKYYLKNKDSEILLDEDLVDLEVIEETETFACKPLK